METDFSILLKTYRKNMGWTQEEMAQQWSYSFETISAWERRKRSPGNQEIPRLAKLLGIDSEELAETIISNKEQPYSQKQDSSFYQTGRTGWRASFEIWGELQHIYRTRTDFNRDFSYASMFEHVHSILATGISLNAIALTYSREALLNAILEEGCNLQLCFLDPKGKKCAEREEEENYPPGTLADLTSVNMHLMKTLYRQIEKKNKECKRQLEIRTYDLAPRFNIYIVDDILMTVQSYAYERGEDTPTFLLRRKIKGGLFDFYASAAQHILAHSININDDITGK